MDCRSYARKDADVGPDVDHDPVGELFQAVCKDFEVVRLVVQPGGEQASPRSIIVRVVNGNPKGRLVRGWNDDQREVVVFGLGDDDWGRLRARLGRADGLKTSRLRLERSKRSPPRGYPERNDEKGASDGGKSEQSASSTPARLRPCVPVASLLSQLLEMRGVRTVGGGGALVECGVHRVLFRRCGKQRRQGDR